ncbi:MAG: nitrilase-related carbon-nitrogen hydrolase [Terriglobales bacterium]
MRLGLVQMQPRWLARDANLASAARLIGQISAEVYLLPELFPSGYTFVSPAEVVATAEPATYGPTLEAMAALARERQAWMVYGFAEVAGERFYNSANVVSPRGHELTYRKIHLFGREKLFFTPGDAPAPVWDTPWGRCGLMVCYDWLFPEIARSLALRGAELLLQPANLVLPHCPQAMITRSLENRIFSATCDRVGSETNGPVTYTFIGQSQVVNPRGEILCRLSGDREETAVVELDLGQARSKRINEANDLFADRQPALY